MSDKRQIIYHDGKPTFMVLPWGEYEALTEKVDEANLSDEELLDLAQQADGEYFPAELVDRLLDEENPIKVYREYRGITQKELAARLDLNPVYISQIETGKRTGSAKTLSRIAKELGVDLDDLV